MEITVTKIIRNSKEQVVYLEFSDNTYVRYMYDKDGNELVCLEGKLKENLVKEEYPNGSSK